MASNQLPWRHTWCIKAVRRGLISEIPNYLGLELSAIQTVMTPPESLPATAAESSLPAPADLDVLARRAAAYARATSAETTRKAYARDWIDFSRWCRSMHLTPMPAAPATVGTYLTALAERLAVATLTRRLAAFSTMHRLSRHRLDTKHPAIRDCLRGIRRSLGTPQRRVDPATTEVVQAMVASCDASLLGLRDRALLLIGFAAALRRSELVALDVDAVSVVAEGLRITVRRSKTDQERAGEVVGVVRTGSVTCPVAALQAWLAPVASARAGCSARSIAIASSAPRSPINRWR